MKSSYEEVIQGFEGPTLIHRWEARSTTVNSTSSLSKEEVDNGAGSHPLVLPLLTKRERDYSLTSKLTI